MAPNVLRLRYELLHMRRRMRDHLDASREEILAFQRRKLRYVIDNAYENVPYYRRLFDRAGIKPEDIRTVDDLAALPTTTKQDLRDAPDRDVIARWANPNRMHVRRTSGSSGRPFAIRSAPFEAGGARQFFYRARRQFGLRPGDRTAALAVPRPPVHRGMRLGRLKKLVEQKQWDVVDCRMSTEQIVRELERLRPDTINGFPGALAHIAPAVAAAHSPAIKPRFIMSGSETLLPSMRSRIEEAFGARLFDTYGSHEFGLLAWECPETGQYHVCDDGMILEVLCDGRPAKEGETGEVVGTSLRRFSMPFIRYRLEDIVVKGAECCSCGQPFSTLRSIHGRKLDYFHLADGLIVHPYELVESAIRGEGEWVGQYQLTQESEGLVVLRIAALRPPRDEELERLRRQGELGLRSKAEFRIELVDGIGFEPSGKFKLSRSLVKSEYDADESEPSPEALVTR